MTAPLFVWLHGGIWCAGGRDPGEPDVPQNAIHCNEHQLEHRAFVLRPIALRRGRFSVPGPGAGSHPLPHRPSPSLSLAGRLIDYVLHQHAAIDPQRVVAAGASMGSYGLWDLITRRPGLVEAAAPCSGAGDPSLASRLNATRIWIFHNRHDATVPVNGSRDMFLALLRVRGIEPHQVLVRSSYEAAIR